jgi:beta-glucosidase
MQVPNKLKLSVFAVSVAMTLGLISCGGGGGSHHANGGDGGSGDGGEGGTTVTQAPVEARSKKLITVDNLQFRDLNANGKLDPYEDWRLSPEERADDLVYSSDPDVRMTLAEKVGLIQVGGMPVIGGDYPVDVLGGSPACKDGETGLKYICEIPHFSDTTMLSTTDELHKLHRRYFVIRTNPPAKTMVPYLNNFQQIAEESRLGIPAVIISNPRNHAASGVGLSEASGVFSYWPGQLGLAATHDPELVKEFAQIAAKEWRTTGIRKLYGYQVELYSEPRWSRGNETFGDDPDLVAKIAAALVTGFQGEKLGTDSVALTIKHFPGNGSAPRGIDSHFDAGKVALYPTPGSLLDWQMKPFQAAIDAGVSSLMPYYQLPGNAGSAVQLPKEYWYSDTQQFEEIGMSYNATFLNYLKTAMGFKGYLNSDSAISDSQPWGVEGLQVIERIAKSLNAGISLLSYPSTASTVAARERIFDVIEKGLVNESVIDAAAANLLRETFQLGLFEQPYLDLDSALQAVNSDDAKAKAALAHRKSIVLLKNSGDVLPLAKTSGSAVKIYGEVFSGNSGSAASVAASQALRDVLARTYPSAQIVSDYTQATHSLLILQPSKLNYYIGGDGNRYTSSALCNAATTDCEENNSIALCDSPTIGDNCARIKAIEAATKTILSLNMTYPWLLDEVEPGAAAILSTYNILSDALIDVLTGDFKPTGRLPMAIPKDRNAVEINATDTPGHLESFDYPYRDTLGNVYTFGFGLNYR